VGPEDLAEVLRHLPVQNHPDIIVGTDTADDAAVFRLIDEMALVQTVDFFTPIVDDPYQFGLIAAANSLSDIYAMGARPLMALNIIGFPSRKLPMTIMAEILQGGAAKASEAGIPIVGGHTVDDEEPKYGLVATGIVHPEEVVTNAGGRPGDVLVLTKPIGTGIISQGIKKGIVNQEVIEEVVAVMGCLNKEAAEAMIEVGVNACTDVTGFGLLGHLHEMASGSGLSAEVRLSQVPIIEAARALVVEGVVPGGSKRNLSYIGKYVDWMSGFSEADQLLLADAQTSGGLLMAVPQEKVDSLMRKLAEREGILAAAVIGELTEGKKGLIRVHE
jgi:selenide,water dikinase